MTRVKNMPNVTLSVDQDVLRKVRKIAVDRDTTLTTLIRDHLENLAASESAERERAAARLEQGFKRLERNMEIRAWTRDDLFDR